VYLYTLIIKLDRELIRNILSIYELSGGSGVELRGSLRNATLPNKLSSADLVLSFELFRSNYVIYKFDEDSCLAEIHHLSENVYAFTERHPSFFDSMYEDIVGIINDKKTYKTDFSLGFGHLDASIYTNCLIRSIYFVEDLHSGESVDEDDNMLHRNVVMSGISNYGQVFALIAGGGKFKQNCVKLMMLLDKQVVKKKVRFATKGPGPKTDFKTEVYVRFNIMEPFSYRDKVNLVYGLKAFTLFRGFLLCASHLTLCETIKKCNYQWNKNEIDGAALLKLSSQPAYFDSKI
jgi:hypothetical protein